MLLNNFGISVIENQTKYEQITVGNFTIKSWLQDNDLKIYETHNERKPKWLEWDSNSWMLSF